MKSSANAVTDEETDNELQPLVAAQANAKRAWWRLWLKLTSLDPDSVMRLLLVVGALLVLGWVIWSAWATLLPFQIGIVLAYLMLPLVNRLEQKMSRPLAAVVVITGFLLLLGLVIGYILPPLIRQLNTLIQQFPDTQQVEQWLAAWNDYLATLPEDTQRLIDESSQEALNSLRNNILDYIRGMIRFIVTAALSVVNTVAFLIGFIVIPFWLFFVLNDQRAGVKAVDRLLPAWLRADFWAIIRMVNHIIGNYFRGQLILAGIVFVAVFLGLNVLKLIGVEGIQFELLLAVFAAFMELIPFIGPILSAVPAIAVGLFHSWETALAILLLFVIIQQVEGNLLVPRIVGDSVNIHPAVVMLLVVLLAPLGLIWLIVAVPLVAIIRDVYRYVYGRFSHPRRPAGLLPDEPLPSETTPPPSELG